MGLGEDLTYVEHCMVMGGINDMHSNLAETTDSFLHNLFSIDANDQVYNNERYATSATLTIGSLVAGGWGIAKGAIRLAKSWRASSQIGKVSNLLANEGKSLSSSNGFLGRRGFELRYPEFQNFTKNNSTTINGRLYSGHALDQMQNRGIMPSVVENAIQNCTGIPNKIAGRTQFYDSVNNISVITGDGNVVTVMHGRSN